MGKGGAKVGRGWPDRVRRGLGKCDIQVDREGIPSWRPVPGGVQRCEQAKLV